MSAEADLVIVGGGPAGMMAGLLFARAGVRTIVLEKHADFLRDFRGDTVHPSTIDLIDELGLLDRFLALPHDRVETVGAVIGGRAWRIADFRHLPAPGPLRRDDAAVAFSRLSRGGGHALPGFLVADEDRGHRA